MVVRDSSASQSKSLDENVHKGREMGVVVFAANVWYAACVEWINKVCSVYLVYIYIFLCVSNIACEAVLALLGQPKLNSFIVPPPKKLEFLGQRCMGWCCSRGSL